MNVWAQEAAHLTLKAASALTFDNNLFRLPAAANKQSAIGQPDAAERIEVASLNLRFSSALSLQKVDLTLGLVRSRYQNFAYLNSSAVNYDAGFEWSLTPQLHGSWRSARNKTQNSFSDYVGLKQSNQRTESSHQLNTVFEIAGPWRFVAGLSDTTQVNQQALIGGGDYRLESAELALSYLLASSSSASLSRQSAHGSYLNRILPSFDFYDDQFGQSGEQLRLHWAMPNNRSTDLYLARNRRSHPNYPTRDFSGLTWAGTVNWQLSGKSALTLSASRTLDSYATRSSNYTQTDHLVFAPSWQISAKLLLRLRDDWARVDYLGAPTALTLARRHDTTRETSIGLDWLPYKQLWLSAALQRARRNSNQIGLDYDSRQLMLSAQYNN